IRHEYDGDMATQLLDVRTNAERTAQRAKVEKGAHREVERLGIEAAETLVDEQGFQPDPAGMGGHDIGQAQRQGERGEEAFPAGERRHGTGPRSEEHTSELQSRENLVCRLLL